MNEILSCTDVNAATDALSNKLTAVLDDLAPVKKFQTRKNYAAWMTKETKLLKNSEM